MRLGTIIAPATPARDVRAIVAAPSGFFVLLRVLQPAQGLQWGRRELIRCQRREGGHAIGTEDAAHEYYPGERRPCVIGAGHLVRVLVVPLLSATLLLPRTASHADERSGSFRATFSGTDQLTVCGTNTYCISDQGTGHAIGFGAATLVAAETESLVDPTSPCGFQVAGTATLSGAAGDSLSLQILPRRCAGVALRGTRQLRPGQHHVRRSGAVVPSAWHTACRSRPPQLRRERADRGQRSRDARAALRRAKLVQQQKRAAMSTRSTPPMDPTHIEQQDDAAEVAASGLSRRGFLGRAGGVAAASVAAGALGGLPLATPVAAAPAQAFAGLGTSFGGRARAGQAFAVREACATAQGAMFATHPHQRRRGLPTPTASAASPRASPTIVSAR